MQVFPNPAKAYFQAMNDPATVIALTATPPTMSFTDANTRRRAIRHFDATPVPDAVMRTILHDALLAPSSGNLQPYQLHWVKDPALKKRIASACEGQRAVHYRAQLTKFARFLAIAPLFLLTPLLTLLSLWKPAFTLLPLGRAGVRHWAARSALLSAQTLMLSATARGLDTCPMEGFNAAKVARLLTLPRGSVVPLVIAIGYRAEGARVEPQSRRAYGEAVVEHG
jgi:nitroreductase